MLDGKVINNQKIVPCRPTMSKAILETCWIDWCPVTAVSEIRGKGVISSNFIQSRGASDWVYSVIKVNVEQYLFHLEPVLIYSFLLAGPCCASYLIL